MQVARALFQLLKALFGHASLLGAGHRAHTASCCVLRPLAQSPAVLNTHLGELQGKDKSVSNVPF